MKAVVAQPGSGDEFTQVGMNQVTARAGAARLSEPFTFFALPDGRCAAGAGGACKAELALTSPAFRAGYFNLQVAGLMQVAVTDLHGNPLSNFDVRFAAQDKPVTVYRLVSKGTIEEQILALHEDKRQLVTGVLDGKDQAARLSTQELLTLLSQPASALVDMESPSNEKH